MPETKAHPAMPGRKTHGEDGRGPATEDSKPAASPTSQRQDAETRHQRQDEELPPSRSRRGGRKE